MLEERSDTPEKARTTTKRRCSLPWSVAERKVLEQTGEGAIRLG